MADGVWVVMIDGDGEMTPTSAVRLLAATEPGKAWCLSMQVLYLWDRVEQVRMDGVYSRFWRPSAFRSPPGTS